MRLSCVICGRSGEDVKVSPPMVWLKILHAHIDHGIPFAALERATLYVAPTGTKRWDLPGVGGLFDVWEGSDIRPG